MGGNGSLLRLNVTQKEIIKNIRSDLLSKILLKKMVLIAESLPNFKTDSLRIILTLVARYGFQLYQMDVKNVFLNGDLEEEIYMDPLKDFVFTRTENMMC